MTNDDDHAQRASRPATEAAPECTAARSAADLLLETILRLSHDGLRIDRVCNDPDGLVALYLFSDDTLPGGSHARYVRIGIDDHEAPTIVYGQRESEDAVSVHNFDPPADIPLIREHLRQGRRASRPVQQTPVATSAATKGNDDANAEDAGTVEAENRGHGLASDGLGQESRRVHAERPGAVSVGAVREHEGHDGGLGAGARGAGTPDAEPAPQPAQRHEGSVAAPPAQQTKPVVCAACGASCMDETLVVASNKGTLQCVDTDTCWARAAATVATAPAKPAAAPIRLGWRVLPETRNGHPQYTCRLDDRSGGWGAPGVVSWFDGAHESRSGWHAQPDLNSIGSDLDAAMDWAELLCPASDRAPVSAAAPPEERALFPSAGQWPSGPAFPPTAAAPVAELVNGRVRMTRREFLRSPDTALRFALRYGAVDILGDTGGVDLVLGNPPDPTARAPVAGPGATVEDDRGQRRPAPVHLVLQGVRESATASSQERGPGGAPVGTRPTQAGAAIAPVAEPAPVEAVAGTARLREDDGLARCPHCYRPYDMVSKLCALIREAYPERAATPALAAEQPPTACVRCGAPYAPSGHCSRREEGCQGGAGEQEPVPARDEPTRSRNDE